MIARHHLSAEVRRDWEASDAHLAQVRAILGGVLIRTANDREDMREATDLVMPSARVAVRTRDAKYRDAYGHEFTLRASRKGGTATELAKITDGHGDALFYGFTAAGALTDWLVLDLAKFRAQLIRRTAHYSAQKNRDGSSTFCAFAVDSLRPSLIAVSPGYWAPAPGCQHPCCRAAAAA